jgi:RNA polymerase sigma factor (sigma-70 family)
MDDKQLIREIGRDNELAFVLLIRKYEKLVYNTAYKLVQNTSDAEDICQEVFISVYKCNRQLRNVEDLPGWLFRIAWNKAISFLRKKNPARANGTNSMEECDCLAASINADETPERSLEDKEVSEVLFQAISELPEMQYKVFVMHNFEDYSHKQICTELNLTKGSVESLIFRAKANLRKTLLNYYSNNFN